MKRRDLIAAAAATGALAGAAGAEAPGDTLYIPQAHRVEDLNLLQDTMDEFPFVDLVTTSPTLRISHIPVFLDRKAGKYGTLYGHVSRQNPQHEAFEGRSTAAILFHGPHAYISPSWYENPKTVPTWNFATVHASGKPQSVADEAALYQMLATLVAKSEHAYAAGQYKLESIPKEFATPLMRAIVGFRMEIEALEGKFKLGQERSEGDRTSIVTHLRAAAAEPGPGDYTARFYEWLQRAPKGR